MIEGIEHRLSASIGIALGHADPDGMLGNADAAAYRAKAHGTIRVGNPLPTKDRLATR